MRAIGIDLGTTNSATAVAGREVKVLPTQAGEQLTPSVVSYVKKRRAATGEIVVGRHAYNNAVRDPINTVFSIKRLMGRIYGEKEVKEVSERFGFRLEDAPPEDAPQQDVRVQLGGQSLTPTEISSLIVKKLAADASVALGESVTHAVITVPAYFEERQRKATAEAGKAAGLKVLKIIDEPTAAALAFGAGKEEQRHRIVVYDLGGGTFDISIIQMTAGNYQVLQIRGDNWLGGDDFDHTIIERMTEWVKDEHGYDPSDDSVFMAKAKIEAEKAKIALSAQKSVEIFAPLFLKVPDIGPVDIEMEIDRDDFEQDIKPFIERTIDLVGEALEEQNLRPHDITEVLLVGGSTAVPAVREAVVDFFGPEKVKRNVNPLECVSLGAAILAAGEPLEEGAESEADGPRVHQVTALHLGIAAVKGDDPDSFVPIIRSGTPYPLSEPRKQIFYPTAEQQTLIRIPVYEGQSAKASLNEQQGVVEFPLPAGVDTSTPIEVSFNYDRNRLLTIGVSVLGHDHFDEQSLQHSRPRVQTVSGKDDSLINDWREDLQPSVRAGRHFLDSYGDYMSPEDRKELSEAIAQGESALTENSEVTGKSTTLLLRNKIMTSGIASQLFIAERAMHDADPEVTRVLAEAIAALRAAHARRDEQEMENLSVKLSMVVAQLAARRADTQPVEDRPDREGKLRYKE